MFQQDFVFDWTLLKYQLKSSGTAATINTGGNDAGEPFVEQPDYHPISQQELQTEVANIFTSLWDKNHESKQKLAFLRSAYSKLTAIYITVPASQPIWVEYLHELSKRGAEIDYDNDRRKAWDITSQEWAKASGA
ncbi:uncharacterized protein PpBr36_10988 [Pyricularia pennisetigena]|uniref:uncharacterized protein n=1 Tax=Pyricularia pennisetigena TaxID=1578925 RepID=UPI001152DB22|nr:uncharacterized protein PpBr36_10988 [Pyricularia pennisetigena]TLS20755.1 hypothetical protein PpBr36_10988 [Pyricularia pennisetigena]